MQTSESYELDLELARTEGACRWITTRSETKHDAQGKIVGLCGTAQDITERKQAEKEREQFFKFFQTSADLMCIADPNGAFMKTNPSCTETLGYSEAELISQPFIEFIHPDDKQATLDEMARQLQKGFSLNFKNRYICKDGSVKWLSWRSIYNKDEGIAYATARDTTDRKRAEEVLKEALEKYRSLATYVDSMYLVDRDCTYLFMNEGHLKRFGLSLEEVIGKRYGEFHSEEDTRQFAEDVGEVCKTGKPSTKEHRSERDGKFYLRTFTPSIGQSSDGKILQVAII